MSLGEEGANPPKKLNIYYFFAFVYRLKFSTKNSNHDLNLGFLLDSPFFSKPLYI